eukprot:6561564-Alexandrium_andersonii.AAC.1
MEAEAPRVHNRRGPRVSLKLRLQLARAKQRHQRPVLRSLLKEGTPLQAVALVPGVVEGGIAAAEVEPQAGPETARVRGPSGPG